MSLVPSNVASLFRRAGWTEGRRVEVDPDVPPGHPGHAVLAELGGLLLERPAANICSIEFGRFEVGRASIHPWERALRSRMVGIAEKDDGHGELYITERGQVIASSLVHPAVSFVGPSFQEAMERIGRGQRFRPMLLPGQHEVMLYGIPFEPATTRSWAPPISRDLVRHGPGHRPARSPAQPSQGPSMPSCGSSAALAPRTSSRAGSHGPGQAHPRGASVKPNLP